MFKLQINIIIITVHLHIKDFNNNIRITINRNLQSIHIPVFVNELPYSFKTVSLITIDF